MRLNETKQVFFTSKGGTHVPMFIVNKKGIKLDGTKTISCNSSGSIPIVPVSSRSGSQAKSIVTASLELRKSATSANHDRSTPLKRFDGEIAEGPVAIGTVVELDVVAELLQCEITDAGTDAAPAV